MKMIPHFIGVAAFGVVCMGAGNLGAQTSSSTSVAEQELELKKKELEVQTAKVEAQKAQELDLEKQKLDLEKQKLALEQAKRDLQVKETSDRLEMALQGDVLFDTGSAVIKPSAEPTLEKVALILSSFPDGKVAVTGFADSRGSEATNLKLSMDRADAVKTWLRAKSGAEADRIVATGKGENEPAASNTTAAGREQNRRVEISVAKL